VQHRGFDDMSADLRLRAENPLNPFGQEASVALNEIAPQLGERHSEARLEFGAAVFSALFKRPRDWRVLLDGQYGQNIAKYRGITGADYVRWQDLVDTGRYNPLRDTQIFGPPQEFYDRVLIHRGGLGRFVTLGDYSTVDAAIRATNHSLKLPTGRGAINFGGDYRRNMLAAYKRRDQSVAEDGPGEQRCSARVLEHSPVVEQSYRSLAGGNPQGHAALRAGQGLALIASQVRPRFE
jgi:hypothetical protein